MGMEEHDELMADGSDSAERRSRVPRLFIKEMVMRNFKSYAGEQRVGPFQKDVKNEAEAYMLKELSLKWQEKATKFAHEDTDTNMVELQANVSSLEQNLKTEREKIRESNKMLKELETVHNKYMRRLELDNQLRSCKEEFKEFERQDVKYREDLKHMKQKIKKLEDILEKDSSKAVELEKKCEDSANLIPKFEENIPKLQKLLLDEEKV